MSARKTQTRVRGGFTVSYKQHTTNHSRAGSRTTRQSSFPVLRYSRYAPRKCMCGRTSLDQPQSTRSNKTTLFCYYHVPPKQRTNVGLVVARVPTTKKPVVVFVLKIRGIRYISSQLLPKSVYKLAPLKSLYEPRLPCGRILVFRW